jgi:hypothetical protein
MKSGRKNVEINDNVPSKQKESSKFCSQNPKDALAAVVAGCASRIVTADHPLCLENDEGTVYSAPGFQCRQKKHVEQGL